MDHSSLLPIISIGYIGALFLVAWLGDKHFGIFKQGARNTIYGLSLAVYCSSWSFLGTVGMSANSLWSYLPVYIAPILLFMFFFPLLNRILRITSELKITSLADFVASRYGKSQGLAATVTLISVVGTLPYFALQLQAMVNSIDIFTPQSIVEKEQIGLFIALLLAIFTILFGTRKLDATEHHPGLMLAIALESIIKLFALLAIGVAVTWGYFDGFSDIWQRAEQRDLLAIDNSFSHWGGIFAQTLVMMASFLCMPRQFHNMMVDGGDDG